MDAKAPAQRISNRADACARPRYLVAVAGPPGAGKSSFAAHLQTELAALGKTAKIVPMDGFHLDNRILRQRGLLSRKGAPDTFDAAGFIHLIQRLAAGGQGATDVPDPTDAPNKADTGNEPDICLPVFDRDRDLAIAGAEAVTPRDRILIVEGNYLLIKDAPWKALHAFWNESLFINPGMAVLKRRLIARWRNQGFDAHTARQKALDNDLPNAEYVLAHSLVPSAPANAG